MLETTTPENALDELQSRQTDRIDPAAHRDIALMGIIRSALVELRAMREMMGPTPETTTEVGRLGDMGPRTSLRVGFDDDRDVYVAVCDESGMAGVEFCTLGTGGGKSPETRRALIALMAAIERDNKADASRDWHARREAGG
ncbi:hypothetical protein [Alcanivorax sp. 1008]|uniref:hypothetical protein n=1 Tax=Alcanivorax sp. 1008 TaxID=2816853 RepID=UPI001E12D1FC|nr:hypothetical protein [Alcanivorax sp. 1008]MCC1496855.1 hypothetical protein [Alcanivorax sp. 1008]